VRRHGTSLTSSWWGISSVPLSLAVVPPWSDRLDPVNRQRTARVSEDPVARSMRMMVALVLMGKVGG